MTALGTLSQRELAVLALLRRSPLTRLQLAERLRLSPSSISRLLDPMLRGKLISEEPAPHQGPGRPAPILRPAPHTAYGIGLDIGALHSRYVVVDMVGELVASHIEPTRQFRDNRDFSEYVSHLGARALAAVYPSRQEVVGIVAAVSGVVDSRRGVCLFCPNIHGPIDIPIASILSKDLGYPVLVEDPARMQALAERRYGVAREAESYLFVHIGIGVGSGIMLGGRLLEGEIGIAGEIGHVVVGSDGPRCNCGNRGCLEAYVSGPSLVRQAREGLERGIYSSLANVAGRDYSGLSVEAINEAAMRGDKLAFHIVNEAGERLGIAIATAVNLLGCPLVVVGGGISNLCDTFYQGAERAMRGRALPMISPHVSIRRSQLDTYAAAWGAATAALDAALETV